MIIGPANARRAYTATRKPEFWACEHLSTVQLILHKRRTKERASCVRARGPVVQSQLSLEQLCAEDVLKAQYTKRQHKDSISLNCRVCIASQVPPYSKMMRYKRE